SVPLSGASGGKTSNAVKTRLTINETAAQIKPFFSAGVKCCKSSVVPVTSSSACSPVYSPKRGITIRSVTHVPTTVNKNTEAAIKNQFIAIFIVSAYDELIVAAASIVSSPSITSVPDNNRFALNPPETPANAAARPASGCRPIAAKTSGPGCATTTEPASHATLDSTPAKTSPIVIDRVGLAKTTPPNRALINPVCSATPIPVIVTSTTPRGANSIKLTVILPN